MLPVNKRGSYTMSILLFVLVFCGCNAADYRAPVRQTQQDPTAVTPTLQANSTDSVTNSEQKWQAATYKGLVMGQATRADMLRVLGPPVESTLGDNQTEWYSYDEVTEFTGELTVVVDQRSSKIITMRLGTKNLSVEEAVKHFGDSYTKTAYDFDKCVEDPKANSLYEVSGGFFRYIEYRPRGIALLLDKQEKQVVQIEYVSQPIGAPKPRC